MSTAEEERISSSGQWEISGSGSAACSYHWDLRCFQVDDCSNVKVGRILCAANSFKLFYFPKLFMQGKNLPFLFNVNQTQLLEPSSNGFSCFINFYAFIRNLPHPGDDLHERSRGLLVLQARPPVTHGACRMAEAERTGATGAG